MSLFTTTVVSRPVSTGKPSHYQTLTVFDVYSQGKVVSIEINESCGQERDVFIVKQSTIRG